MNRTAFELLCGLLFRLTLVVSLIGSGIANAQSGRPAFAYTSLSDPEALEVVNRYFTSDDYISTLIASRIPELGKRVGRSHQYKLVESMDKLTGWAEKGCGDSTSPGLIVYDIEKWDATPVAEQENPAGSINQGGGIVKKTGCQNFGIAPSRVYLSKKSTQCDAVAGGVLHGINWRMVDFLIIQGQGMLRNNCTDRFGVKRYVDFVATIGKIVKTNNPGTKVFAEMSFRYTAPSQMFEVIERLKDSVDGFYLAMPSGMDNCLYCTAGSLDIVLSRYRTRQ